MSDTKRIFGIGTVVVDHVVALDAYPKRDTKAVIQSHWRQIGGPVPVALSTAANYGLRTHFAGRWGNDVAGHEIRTGLSERGIDLTPSSSDDAWQTGFAHVWTEPTDGTRTIAFSRGEFPPPSQSDIQTHFSILDTCEILHLDGAASEAALTAAERTKRNGGIVVLDAGSKKPGMEHLLPLVDVIIASDLFCRSWFGADVPCSQIHELGPGAVVRTRGPLGAIYSDGNQEHVTSAIKIDPVDTNGAGDIFAGAFLYGLAHQWPVPRTMQFACFVAGHACCHPGNATVPDIASFEEQE